MFGPITQPPPASCRRSLPRFRQKALQDAVCLLTARKGPVADRLHEVVIRNLSSANDALAERRWDVL